MPDVQNILRDINQAVLFQIALIVVGAWLLTAVIQRLLPWLAGQFSGRQRLYMLALVPVLRLVIIVFAILLIIPRVVEPTPENLITLLGLLGVALGFAFKDYVSSLIAGVVSLYELPFRPGDWIEVEKAYGEVKAIGLRAAEIVTPDDTVVIIPHLKLWDKLIFNANDGSQKLMCVADFYLQPDHDAGLIKDTLYDVALTSPFLQHEYPILVIVMEKPWGTHYRLKAYPVEPRDQFQFITDLTIRGKAALLDLGATFVTATLPPEGPVGQ